MPERSIYEKHCKTHAKMALIRRLKFIQYRTGVWKRHTLWHKIITYEELFWNKYFRKNYEFHA